MIIFLLYLEMLIGETAMVLFIERKSIVYKVHNQTMFETNNEILWKETQTILPWVGFNCQSLKFISIEQKAY